MGNEKRKGPSILGLMWRGATTGASLGYQGAKMVGGTAVKVFGVAKDESGKYHVQRKNMFSNKATHEMYQGEKSPIEKMQLGFPNNASTTAMRGTTTHLPMPERPKSGRFFMFCVAALVFLPMFMGMAFATTTTINPFTCDYQVRDCYGGANLSCPEDTHDYETDMGSCFMYLVWNFTIGIVINHPLLMLYCVIGIFGIICLVVVAGIVLGVVGGVTR